MGAQLHRKPGAWALCSVSSAGPEAAAGPPDAPQARRRGGPGEDRHLTRGTAQYAQGCWWGWVHNPTGCPAASERRFDVRTT